MFGYDGYHLIDKTEDKTILSQTLGERWNEVVMVSFNQLSDNGNNILFFAANNDIGVMAAVQNFCNTEWLGQFYTTGGK